MQGSRHISGRSSWLVFSCQQKQSFAYVPQNSYKIFKNTFFTEHLQTSVITSSCSNSWKPQTTKWRFFLTQAPKGLTSRKEFFNLSTEAVEDVNISTFGNSKTLSKSIDRVLLVAKTSNHKNILIKALCLPMLCLPISSPNITFLKRQFEKFHGIEFVDEDSEKEIDLLIGSDLYWCFVTGNIVEPGESGSLVAVETKLGWIFKWLCWCGW